VAGHKNGAGGAWLASPAWLSSFDGLQVVGQVEQLGSPQFRRSTVLLLMLHSVVQSVCAWPESRQSRKQQHGTSLPQAANSVAQLEMMHAVQLD
jgi:hypothetical protein